MDSHISSKATVILSIFFCLAGFGLYAGFHVYTHSHSVVSESISDPDGYFLPEADSVQYSREELEKLSVWELYLARNEIFARHGRLFVQHGDLNDYFMTKNWYSPRYTYEEFAELDAREPQLNTYEIYNVNVMLEIEKDRNSPYID